MRRLGRTRDGILEITPRKLLGLAHDGLFCIRTEPSTGEMEGFLRDLSQFKDKGATVVGISCDSFACHKAFAQAHGLTITLLADLRRQVCKAYGFFWPEMNVSS